MVRFIKHLTINSTINTIALSLLQQRSTGTLTTGDRTYAVEYRPRPQRRGIRRAASRHLDREGPVWEVRRVNRDRRARHSERLGGRDRRGQHRHQLAGPGPAPTVSGFLRRGEVPEDHLPQH